MLALERLNLRYLGSRRPLLPRLIVFIALVTVGLWVIASLRYAARVSEDSLAVEDYVVFYSAGSLIADGEGDLIYDRAAMLDAELRALGLSGPSVQGGEGGMPFLNPGFVALAYAPLSLLPLPAAAVLVAIGSALLIAAAAYCLLAFLGIRETQLRLLLGLGFASFIPVIQMYSEGQLTVWPFLGLLGLVWFLGQGRDREAGLSLALLVVKPQFALLPFVLLLWQRRWRAIAAFSVAASALVLVSLAAVGPGGMVAYPRLLLEVASWDGTGGVHRQWMYGWSGFVSLFLPFGGTAHAIVSNGLVVATLLVVVWAFAGGREPRSPAFLDACAVLVLAMLLASPHLNNHDLTLVALALAFSARASQLRSGGYGELPLVAALVWVVFYLGRYLIVEYTINVETPLMAGLLIWSARRARADETAMAAGEPAALPSAAA